jgi:hypothetical protein
LSSYKKYHKLGVLNNRHFFLTVLEVRKSRIKVPADSGSGEGSQPDFWLISVILSTWEAEIGKTEVPGQPRQRACKIPSPKNRAKWTTALVFVTVISHLEY